MERTSAGDALCSRGTAVGRHLVPIVIAVTGHRDLRAADVPRLEEAVRELFAALRNRYPSTPLRVLSGLAEGADRLAANVALQQSAELVAVLPMPRADYERDFPAAESLDEFRRLLSQACGEIVVDAAGPGSAERRSCYAGQGAYLIEHCDILWALWDGEQSDKTGGTAEVVRFRLDGVPTQNPHSGSYLERRVGDVHQIVTPRRSNAVASQDCGQVRILAAKTAGSRSALLDEPDPTLAAIDGLNRCLAGNVARSAADSVPPAPEIARDLEHWRARFHLLDSLAIRYQARTWRALTWMLLCSLLAMVSLQLQAILPEAAPFLQFVFVCMLLAAYAIYGWSKHRRYESQAFDYRALAEGLRIQICWRVAGLNALAADHYLGRQRDVLQWIRRALLNWESHRDARQLAEAVTLSSLSLAREHWIRDQMEFFERTATRQRFLNRWFVGAANGLVLLGLLIGGLNWLSIPWPGLLSCATILPTIAATLLIYSKTRAWSEQVNQYESMRDLYQVAEHNLQQRIAAGDLAGGKGLLMELGREALAENADWLTLHRRRPLSSPSLGSS